MTKYRSFEGIMFIEGNCREYDEYTLPIMQIKSESWPSG